MTDNFMSSSSFPEANNLLTLKLTQLTSFSHFKIAKWRSEQKKILEKDQNLKSLPAAFELNVKWLNCWLHLLLSICRLGGSHGKQFARSFAHIVLGENWKQIPTLCEFLYANYLKINLENNNINDFGLMEALKDQAFYIEFIHFAHSDEGQLHNYSNLYEWVKHHIWYIVIHQQQIEETHLTVNSLTQQNIDLESNANQHIANEMFETLFC
ncbi:unnamed protein product [Rhizophagus irregularis]|nr:unnamed protein product [Rhizophagus irregularis]